MEDPRLSVMYWKLLLGKLERRAARSARRRPAGTVTGTVIGLLLVGALLAQFEYHRGDYTKLKEHLTPAPPPDRSVQPGGQEPMVLSRSPIPGSPNPEFLSVTLLPGRGMNVLGIMANLPDKGPVELLAGSSLADAASAMTGMGDDAAGQASLTHGAPILSPWAGILGGTVSRDGRTVTISWQGRTLTVPANTVGTQAPAAYGGLLGRASAVNAETTPMPDGGALTTLLPAAGEGWGAGLQTKVSVLMSSRVVDIGVVVKNVGTQAVPVGIGWAPRFMLPSGDRTRATLHVPAAARSVVRDARTGMPSGKLEELSGAYGFDQRNGLALGHMSLNDTFLHLRAKFDESPTVELRDPESKMGLRIMARSPTIKAIHVFAPADANFISISPQMNYDDPFGKEWGGEDTGMKVLEPGKTVEWKVRLELFSLLRGDSPLL